MLYMVKFTINIPPMLAYIPYMDPMGSKFIILTWHSSPKVSDFAKQKPSLLWNFPRPSSSSWSCGLDHPISGSKVGQFFHHQTYEVDGPAKSCITKRMVETC